MTMHTNLAERRWVSVMMDPRRPIAVPMYGHVTVVPDWFVPTRRLPLHLMYFVTDGAMRAKVADNELELTRGTFLWIAAGTGHELSIPPGKPPFRVIFVRVSVGRGHTGGSSCGHAFLALDDLWDVQPHLQRIVDERQSTGGGDESVIRASFALVATTAFRRATRLADTSGGARLAPAQRHAIEQLADADPAARPEPVELARVAGLSGDYFARVFRRTYGLPPRAWLVRRRVRRVADELARSTSSIAEVARAHGYDDLFFFSRQFKQVTGRSPRQFRGAP
jgi:AraC-like DNA-binding protein/quercetin dioxygenase-like cupin family protein